MNSGEVATEARPPTERASAEQSWPLLTAGICAIVLTTYIAFGVAVPMLPELVLGRPGGSPVLLGLSLTVSSLAAFGCRPYCGRLAQRFGSRPLMMCGCLLGALASGLYAAPFGLIGVLLARLATGLSIASLFTAGAVWIVALAPTTRRGQVMGWYGLAGWGGNAIGPLLTPVLIGWAGNPAVWWLAAATPLLALVGVAVLAERRERSASVDRRLVPRAVWIPGVALCLAASGYSALFGFIVPLLRDRGIGHGSVLLGAFAGAYVAARLVAGSLPDRCGARPVFFGCVVTETAGLALITVAHSWWVAMVGTIALGAGLSILYPTLAVRVLDRARAEERGAALGAYTSFWDLGLAATGLLAGGLALYGYGCVFAAATGLAVLAGVVGLGGFTPLTHRLARSRQRHTEQ